MIRLALVLSPLWLAAVATGQKEADAKVAPGPSAPRGKVLEWTSAQGKPYWYRLPKKIDAKHPPHLILMLHGTGLKWGWAFWNYPIASGRFRGDDIVVAPEGMTPGQGGTFNFVQNKDDREQIAGLIRDFRDKLPVGKVYLYGHSQGAFFCYWFAGEHPELVDGIVAHAGNVLANVKHPKLAQEKVAIGILHGRADAVVPVDCAYATEKVYREHGYRNVKLYVVDGLTPQSGHWPLPVQVGEMLDWLDAVTVDDAGQAVAAAEALIAKDRPAIEEIAQAVDRAGDLLRHAGRAEREALEPRMEKLAAFLDRCGLVHGERLASEASFGDAKTPFGSWAVHFRIAQRALGDRAEWKKLAKPQASRAKKHERRVARAIKQLQRPSTRSFRSATAALEDGFLASGYDELRGLLERLAAQPPRGVTDEQAQAVRSMIEQRAAAEKAGREAAVAATLQARG